MAVKNSVSKAIGGMELYLKKIFGLMTGAVGITALTTFISRAMITAPTAGSRIMLW